MNKNCGPDIVKFFSVVSSGSATGSTGDFNVCNGTTFVTKISGCTDNVNFNGNIFNNDGSVIFDSTIQACSGVYTSNLYGCSPITIHDNLQSVGSNAGGTLSLAFGNNTLTTASYSHAEGRDSSARAVGSHAEGFGTVTFGNYSHAEGFGTTTLGNYSHAEGYQTLTSGFTSNTQGRGTIAYGDYSYAGGFLSKARGNTSFIHSTNSIVLGSRSVVLGGENLTGSTDDTVYVPYLNINNLLNNQAVNNLGIDSNGNVVVGFSDGIYVTGGTYNQTTDTIILKRNDGVEISITGVTDTFTTGATLNGNTLEFNRTDLSNAYFVDLSPLVFTGNTSGNCISDLYVSNIHSCSPLNINPNDEGNIYFGSTSGVTIDISTGNISANSFTGDGSGLYNLSISGISNTFVTGFTYNNANTFTISRNNGLGDLTSTFNSVTGLTVNGELVISGNTNISETPQIDTNPVLQLLTRDSSSGDVKIKPVPNTLNYGLFSQTGDSITIVNTDVETSIIDGGVGTLSVPINGFQIGDSFRVVMGGVLSNLNNEDIRIRLKSDSIVLADSGFQNLTQHSNDIFRLVVDFTIRSIGGTNVASIVTLGSFQTIKKNSSDLTGFGFESVNNTSFDTTISNKLDITVEWDNANNGNSIKSQVFTLNKVY